MKRWNIWVGLALVAIIGMCASCSALGDGSTGVRLWVAQYDQTFSTAASSFTFKGGYAPMVMVQFNGRLSDDVSMVTIIGYGQGWDEDEGKYALDMEVRRGDAALGFSYRIDYFSIGVGGHGIITWNELNRTDGTWVEDQFYGFFGPEIFGGGAYPFWENRLVAQASASVMPIVFWVHDVDTPTDNGSDTGTTFAYSLDAGLMLLLGEFFLGGGYRYQIIDQIDYELEWDGGGTTTRSHEDEFQGPYVQAGWRW